eukprot:TRINITY_DN9040_c0_g2_i1.p1 TRINITY_DN9040_c0_g2~~TRINITY_DN9040_c0_g2_i1.p1  ORF type:complete len:212 (-),score=47.27 TRINITY_DN9040_c0_g2_i1:98-673(-)
MCIRDRYMGTGFNDTYTGGLCSYGLILMLVAFMQEKATIDQRLILPQSPNLGTLLLEFLRYYGRDFDYHNRAVTVQSLDRMDYAPTPSPTFAPNPFEKFEKKIMIVDPLSEKNDVGRSTFLISNIQDAFFCAYIAAHQKCMCELHNTDTWLPNDEEDNEKLVRKMDKACFILQRIFSSNVCMPLNRTHYKS